MYSERYISNEELQENLNKELSVSKSEYNNSIAPHYTEYVRRELEKIDTELDINIYEDGYKKGEHLYQSSSPKNEVYILDDDNNKIQLTKQDYLNISLLICTYSKIIIGLIVKFRKKSFIIFPS